MDKEQMFQAAVQLASNIMSANTAVHDNPKSIEDAVVRCYNGAQAAWDRIVKVNMGQRVPL
jgi:hypothetical protein